MDLTFMSQEDHARMINEMYISRGWGKTPIAIGNKAKNIEAAATDIKNALASIIKKHGYGKQVRRARQNVLNTIVMTNPHHPEIRNKTVIAFSVYFPKDADAHQKEMQIILKEFKQNKEIQTKKWGNVGPIKQILIGGVDRTGTDNGIFYFVL